MEEKNFENEEVLKENQKYFNFYLVLPKIVAIVLAVLFGLAGFGAASGDGGFGMLLVTWILGAIVCAIVYYLMKLSLSYNILHIYYLKKIAEKGEVKQEVEQEETEEKISL